MSDYNYALEEDKKQVLSYIRRMITKNGSLQAYFEKSRDGLDDIVMQVINTIYREVIKGENRQSIVFKVRKDAFKDKVDLKEALIFTEQVVEVSNLLNAETIFNKENTRRVKKYALLKRFNIQNRNPKKPSICTPVNWTKRPQGYGYTGGYKDFKTDLVSIKLDDKKQPDISNKALEAINYIQSTKWQVNEGVLEVLINNYDNLNSNIQTAVDMARSYLNEKIYFPHHFDFRGRLYATSTNLSPQGCDAVKSLLQYANAEKPNEAGIKWCWAYLANLYDTNNKPNFESKIKIGIELINADYLSAKEPYQFLAHQLEMKKWLLNNNYEIKTPIHLDAHASAIQIISAITKNKTGLEQTNVLPTYNSQGELYMNDFYQLISNGVLSNLEIEKNKIVYKCGDTSLIEIQIDLLKSFGRKISKTVLIYHIYGAGDASIIDEIKEFTDSKDTVTKPLVKYIKQEYEEQFPENIEFEKQIKKLVRSVCKNKVAPVFETLDGFQVVCRKYKKKINKIEGAYFKKDGKKVRTTLNINEDTKVLDTTKITTGIIANLIHATDASLLRLVALKMREKGIFSSSFIHDSFGTSPNQVDTMLALIKISFIEIIESNLGQNFYKQLKGQAIKPIKTDGRLTESQNKKEFKKIELYNSKLNDLKLELANEEFDVNTIKDSEWAFS